MYDERLRQLAKKLVNYSCNVQPGENVLIELTGEHFELTNLLVQEVYQAKGVPFVKLNNLQVRREILLNANEEQFSLMADSDAEFMKKMQAYIGVRGGTNASELSDVPAEKTDIYDRIYWQRVHSEIRVRKTKWVVLRYPSPSMAQMANMSTESFEEYYFNVCNLDYSRMDKAMDVLKEWMEKADKVRITAKNTDLTFSIKNIPAIKCSGRSNIPDGEIYTAPVKDSVNGTIQYNTQSLENGFTYENIRFKFKGGKIVEAICNDNTRINKLLDTDEGARYIGEFAIGVNPYILTPMKDTLFDEKISGSIHFTPGASYDEAPNGNRSAVHWDLVLIQRPEYGGGELFFDDVLIRKDGLFVPNELKLLNPENLK